MPIYLLLLGLAILGSYGFVIIRKGNPNGKLFIRVILVTIFTVVIGKQAWSFYQFDQEFNQHAKTVHELIPIYQTLLVLDARFESVKVMGTTAGNRCV